MLQDSFKKYPRYLRNILVQQDETLYIFAHPKPLVISDDKH